MDQTSKMETNHLSDEDLNLTWNKYFASKQSGTPDVMLQNKLVGHYYELAKTVAKRVRRKITEVPIDELISMGVDGLYYAVSHYDPAFKTKFHTYATPRVRGAMLDAIRESDWIPRLVRSKVTWLDKQRQVLESKYGKHLTDDEMANELGKTKEEFNGFVKSCVTPSMYSVNDAVIDSDDLENSLSIESLEDVTAAQPLDEIVREELFNKLMGKNFTAQERKIIWLYYFDDRSMKEISEIVGLSESRVSQMHGIILERLRQKVERNPVYFSDVWDMINRFRWSAVECV